MYMICLGCFINVVELRQYVYQIGIHLVLPIYLMHSHIVQMLQHLIYHHGILAMLPIWIVCLVTVMALHP